MTDYLWRAATAKAKAENAKKKGDYESAWKLQHIRLCNYLGHAKREQFTRQQVLNLASCVYDDLANLLRVEKKHERALSFLLLALCSTDRPTQSLIRKLPAYAKRAGVDVQLAEGFINASHRDSNIRDIENQVRIWAAT